MGNKKDLRGEFLDVPDQKESFETPNGQIFQIEPIQVKDIIESEQEQEKRLNGNENAKSESELRVDLIIRHTYDNQGERLFEAADKQTLLTLPFQSEYFQSLLDAFNEVNDLASINEEGDLEVDDFEGGGAPEKK